MNRQHIRIGCQTLDCPNYTVLHGEDFLVKQPWTCPVCLDAIDLVMVQELERRSLSRNHHDSTQPETEQN